MNVATDGCDYPMCVACQLILGNNKSDEWDSLADFGNYSANLQKERGYKVLRRRDEDGKVLFEPINALNSF